MTSRFSRALLILPLLLGLAPTASADVAPRWTDQQLAALSELIVTGRVEAVTPGWDPNNETIYTYVTIAVDDVLKGSIAADRIVIKQIGGEVGGLALKIFGQPVFLEGERVIAFLEVRPRDSTVYTTALWQGKWSQDQTSNEWIRRDPENPAGSLDLRPASFVEQIRAAGGVSSGAFMQLNPSEAPAAGTSASFPFTFLGPSRWHKADNAQPVAVRVQSSGEPAVPGGGLTQIATARGLINAASNLRLSDGGLTASRCSTFSNTNGGNGTGLIDIAYRDPCGEISNSGSTLAIGGGYWFTNTDIKTVSGQNFFGFIEGYVITNDSANTVNLFGTARCFQDVLTHELLHAVGLGHSSDSNAIMFPTVDNACFSAVQAPASGVGARFEPITGALGSDDVAALQFIYPGGGAPPPPPPPPPPPGQGPGAPNVSVSPDPVPAGQVFTVSWSAGTGGAPTSYTASVGTSQGGSNIFGPQNVGLVTSGQGSLPNGNYWVRILASNSIATAFTDRAFTVGTGAPPPCTTAPPAPTNLQITSKTATTIAISWNAAPGATSYRVQADLNGQANVFNVDIGNFLAAQGVDLPAGSYAVRIFGVNSCGTSSTSLNTTFSMP